MNSPSLNPLTRFLCHCAGAYPQLLKECPTEINKYTGIGATILFTGLLAALSGGYALFSIFADSFLAVPGAFAFGALWGLLIFNLDRYIVSSLKRGSAKWQQWLMALPRLLIALLISVVISKPLEVRIFQDRIERQLHETQLEKMMSDKQRVEEIFGNDQLETKAISLDNQLREEEGKLHADPEDEAFAQLMAQMEEAREDYETTQSKNESGIRYLKQRIQNIYEQYPNRLFDSNGKLVAESIPATAYRKVKDYRNQSYKLYLETKEKRQQYEALEAQVKRRRAAHQKLVSAHLATLKNEQAALEKQRQRADSLALSQMEKGYAVNKLTYSANFVTQLEALGTMTQTPYTTMWWASWFISMLFVVIETSPIMVKLIAGRGPYDAVLERYEYQALLENKKKALEAGQNVQFPPASSANTTPLQPTLPQTKQNPKADLEQVAQKHEEKASEKPYNTTGKVKAAEQKPTVQVAPKANAGQQQGIAQEQHISQNTTSKGSAPSPVLHPTKQQPILEQNNQEGTAEAEAEKLGKGYLQVIRNQVMHDMEAKVQHVQQACETALLSGKTWRLSQGNVPLPFDCLVFRNSSNSDGQELMTIFNGSVHYGYWKLLGKELYINMQGGEYFFELEALSTTLMRLREKKRGTVFHFQQIA